jgi:hypothetical protein
MDIKKEDTVRLKGSQPLMSIIKINTQYNEAECVWIDEKGDVKYQGYGIHTLEVVSNDEVKKIRKAEQRRKDAKAGASWADKASKWATAISAIGVIVLGIFYSCQNNKMKSIEEKLEKLIEIQNNIKN